MTEVRYQVFLVDAESGKTFLIATGMTESEKNSFINILKMKQDPNHIQTYMEKAYLVKKEAKEKTPWQEVSN